MDAKQLHSWVKDIPIADTVPRSSLIAMLRHASCLATELQAGIDNLNAIIDKYARHKHLCKMGEYNTIIRGEGKGCNCGLTKALKGE